MAALLSTLAQGQSARVRIGAIEFFGASGRDIAALRAALPLREGTEVDAREMNDLVARMRATTKAADVAVVCCERQSAEESWTIFIGWPDGPGEGFRYAQGPRAKLRLPAEGLNLAQVSWAVWQEAQSAGLSENGKPSSDLDNKLRATELAIRQYTMRHVEELRRILRTSSDAQHRAIAAHFLSYGRRSRAVVSTLAGACHDQDEGVRDNAARSLMVLMRTDMRVSAWVPAADFVAMLHSGHWSDRQRAAVLLLHLSAENNPKLLSEIRGRAWPVLLEMARWRGADQAGPARQLLGRAGGLDEPRLQALLRGGNVDALLEAVATIH
ncbi:hypothetical protein [Paludibaculum fermentans]|uniref:Uncharacterized protein n=1 Tax=Paludibaculum fermentans TaxID=1473598 RepID=A0A7S7NR65_PALFE|nr:hypothetical protein [Paludibaculum fermentans]QOY88307.1 hypothetical protein IRI77_37185 [Paludibaculum fermentans]